jgi:hypothetical protein
MGRYVPIKRWAGMMVSNITGLHLACWALTIGANNPY